MLTLDPGYDAYFLSQLGYITHTIVVVALMLEQAIIFLNATAQYSSNSRLVPLQSSVLGSVGQQNIVIDAGSP